ncbi:MAG: MarR family transcriptional regulator [Verrucomicrobiota bacterium]
MRRLPPLLRRAWFSLNQAFRQRLIPLGITPDQFTILRWLSECDPSGLTQSEITQRMASDPNTITSTVRRMEKAGLLERLPHESDRRAKRVRLLPLGRSTFNRAQSLAAVLQKSVLGCLDVNETAVFLELLERIGDAAAQETEIKKHSYPALEILS